MHRSHALSLGLVAVIVVGVVVPPAAAAGPGGGLSLQENVDPDLVNLNVFIQEDGRATWEIEYFVRLRTENETRAFEDLMADVEANSSTYVDRFAERMNATVESAEESTGREMSASDFGVSAEIRTLGNQYGVLTYTFTWNDFATVSDGEISAGDALEGFFLDQETSLQFSWPEEYEIKSITPEPSERRDTTAVYRGQLDFSTGEPSVTLGPVSQVTTTTQTITQTTDGQTEPEPDESASSLPWIIGGLVLLGLAGAGVWYFQKQQTEPGGRPTQGGGPPDEDTPAELLSNEERVEQYLGSHGRRAKQQEIVEGLGWTEAKTSQVLSDMQEAGRIEKFRIGRENVVKLPDRDDETE